MHTCVILVALARSLAIVCVRRCERACAWHREWAVVNAQLHKEPLSRPLQPRHTHQKNRHERARIEILANRERCQAGVRSRRSWWFFYRVTISFYFYFYFSLEILSKTTRRGIAELNANVIDRIKFNLLSEVRINLYAIWKLGFPS